MEGEDQTKGSRIDWKEVVMIQEKLGRTPYIFHPSPYKTWSKLPGHPGTCLTLGLGIFIPVDKVLWALI